MIAYYPMPNFIPISISPCKLMCKHCMGKYLEGMKKVYNKNELLEFANKNLNGILISGGFDRKGRLMNLKKMLPAMKILKNNFCIALHPGFIDEKTAYEISKSTDIVFVDLPSNNAIKNVYGLNAKTDDYFKNMEILINAGAKVSPHITVGLNYGKIEEWELLDRVRNYPITKLVIDVIIPTKGTPFENVSINIEELKNFFKEAKKKIKRIALGCMRPRNGIDKIAYEIGIKEIAVPSIHLLQNLKEEVIKRNVCCGCP